MIHVRVTCDYPGCQQEVVLGGRALVDPEAALRAQGWVVRADAIEHVCPGHPAGQTGPRTAG